MSTTNGNGKPARTLDPEAERAITRMRVNLEELVGDIMPSNLILALPRRGPNRSYNDAIAAMLLAHIISQYRVPEKHDPWWGGDLYRLDRETLAKRWGTYPDAVSDALSFLIKLGFVVRRKTPVHDDEGNPINWNIHVWPKIDAIVDALKNAKAGDLPAKSTKPRRVYNRLSDDPKKLYTPKSQALETTGLDTQNHRFRQGKTTGLEKAKPQATPLTASEQRQNNNENVSGAQASLVSPSATEGAKPPGPPELYQDSSDEDLADYFIYYWNQSFHQFFGASYRAQKADRAEAIQYFTDYDHDPDEVLVLAERAWVASAAKRKPTPGIWSDYFQCLKARSIQYFFRHNDKIIDELKKDRQKNDGWISEPKLKKAIQAGITKWVEEHYGDDE